MCVCAEKQIVNLTLAIIKTARQLDIYKKINKKEEESCTLITLYLVQRLLSSVNISNVFSLRRSRVKIERESCIYCIHDK